MVDIIYDNVLSEHRAVSHSSVDSPTTIATVTFCRRAVSSRESNFLPLERIHTNPLRSSSFKCSSETLAVMHVMRARSRSGVYLQYTLCVPSTTTKSNPLHSFFVSTYSYFS
jgi:hypothetical protein